MSSFQLPDPAGRAGGALTSAMLKTLYADHQKPDDDLSFQDVLLSVRDILAESVYTQIPQLSSSRPLDIKSPFEIVPDGNTGTKRAVIIGINYVGQQGELAGCQNDAKTWPSTLKTFGALRMTTLPFSWTMVNIQILQRIILSMPLVSSSTIPRPGMLPLFTTRVTEERSATITVTRVSD